MRVRVRAGARARVGAGVRVRVRVRDRDGDRVGVGVRVTVLYSCVCPSSKATFTLSGVPSAYSGWPTVAPWKLWTIPKPCLGCSTLAPETRPAW